MQSRIQIDINVPMEMRDGVVLRGNVYRPGDREKAPGILIRTPYGKLAEDSDYLKIMDVVLAGYAVVAQDVRGRFDSEGEYKARSSAVEGPDGYDSVEWLASQTWCDGNVGMMGASQVGAVQWMAAVENPPHLKAISPWICGAGTRDETLLAGTLTIQLMANWTALRAFDVVDRLERQGKDVSEMRELLNRAVAHPEILYEVLPLKDIPLARFEGVREVWEKRLSDIMPGPEQAGKAQWAYNKVTVPCYQQTGWYDMGIWGGFENFFKMKKEGSSAPAREGQYMVVGPWAHSRPLQAFLGEINFGVYAQPQKAQMSEHTIAFFDKYLRGMDVELPAIRYFVMGLNAWREADTWPLPQTEWRRFFLNSKGGANTSAGDGVLSQAEPGSECPDIFVYDPHRPVPSTGGRGTCPPWYVAGPIDQSHIEKRGDILCYTTAELEQDTEITGPLALHLFAATSARDTDFNAKLVDVYPDGRAYNVADGAIRARYRKSIFEPELVTPGEVNEYTINMGHTSQVFRKGHRIRIDITSSNFPWQDRNMNTGNPIGEDAEGIPATQTIYHESGYASYIDLPLIPSGCAS